MLAAALDGSLDDWTVDLDRLIGLRRNFNDLWSQAKVIAVGIQLRRAKRLNFYLPALAGRSNFLA